MQPPTRGKRIFFENEKRWLDRQYHSDKTVKRIDEIEHPKGQITYPPTRVDEKIFDRVHGSLQGLAIGDALGASVEFRPRQFLVEHPVEDIQSGGTWGLAAGEFTDDTSMALCLASSLILCRGFVPYDQLVRYKWWFREGYMSSTGKCFDIGSATKASIVKFEERQEEFKKKHNISSNDIDYFHPEGPKAFPTDCGAEAAAGNGPLMRLCPVPLFFYRDPVQAVHLSGCSASTTHGSPIARDACRYFGALIVAALHDETVEQLLDREFYGEHREWFGDKPLHEEVMKVAKGSYMNKKGYDGGIRGKGFSILSLEAALWALWTHKHDFKAGALAAVNLGDDTDTTAAIYGQLAGALCGYSELPKQWKDRMYGLRYIKYLSEWIVYEGERSSAPASSSPTTTYSNSHSSQSGRTDSATTPKDRPTSNTVHPQSSPTKKEDAHRMNQTNYDYSSSPYSRNDPPLASAAHRSRALTASDLTFQTLTTDGSASGLEPQSAQGSSSGKPGYLLDRLRTPDDVCEFLRKLDGGSDSYASIFRQKDIDGFWLLNHTDVPSLVKLGIKNQNYQEKLIREIEKLRLEATQTANQTSARASDAPDCHHSNGGPTNNSYKRK